MNSSVAVAFISALGGGAFVYILSIFFLPKSTREDFATKLRNELRSDIKEIRIEKERLEKELDEWKTKYYQILEKYTNVIAKYEDLLNKNQELERKINNH